MGAETDHLIRDENYQGPSFVGSNITFKTKYVNQYLTCLLCGGYFREACTITECLHTYCRSCLVELFLDKSKKSQRACPRCNFKMKSFAESVRFDTAMQGIVNKVFKSLVEEDKKNEEEFYKSLKEKEEEEKEKNRNNNKDNKTDDN